ncbi:MAG TPA: DUF1816 domain-containing protein [Xenococcaceae cyanobacterium]
MLENHEKLNAIKQEVSAQFDWWIEIRTANPGCIYYFGAFYRLTAATSAQYGFIQDLKAEEAKIVSVSIKQCQPQKLTICEQELPSIAIEPLERKIAQKPLIFPNP